MADTQAHVSIIILNWNGWQDTIECLESVLKSDYENFRIILVDNCSQDSSLKKIKNWAVGTKEEKIKTNLTQYVYPLADKPLPFGELTVNSRQSLSNKIKKAIPEKLPLRSILLVRNFENSGFAAGNNLGIKIANLLFNNRFIYLLNNDTVIEPSTLSRLTRYLELNPAIGIASSGIYYYSDPQKIANLGGKLTPWGTQRYYTRFLELKKQRVTFITGCAMMIRSEILEQHGLLSEKFFFGEEDFELSWRFRKKKIPMACVPESRVYHKISVSAEKMFKSTLRKQFIYVFTRVVDMRDYFWYPVWLVWKWLISFYSFFWLTIKYRINARTALKFSLSINRYARVYNDAKKSTVEKIYQEIGL